ncbi:hypothetical protein QBC39DRAFT_366241 [Podospora conica]|nr:hypothetical protein QBC39DRAFT_366241 [Schizothecium conicum]
MAASAPSADTAAEATQLTFKVKSSSDKIHTLSMPETASVLDLKTKLAGADYEDVPVERQRLIYSGRVMKNDDALSVYKIKNLNTIHMVKSAASNPASAPAAASAPTPQAIPHNMASGTSANNLMAGLTGARYAGHANLPSRDIFGADGGMGAPPNEDQMAAMLENPTVAQTVREALDNPAFVEHMIQSNPTLAAMPNAREMLTSPYFRNMMSNPDALRVAARMRRAMSGQGGGGAFPAPGVTDGSDGATGDNSGAQMPPGMFFPFPGMGNPSAFGAPPAGSAATAANPFGNLFGPGSPFGVYPAPGAAAAPGATPEAGSGAAPAPGDNAAQQTANPFAALFGSPPAGQAANPFGLPAMSPEAAQQMMQMWGMGSPVGGGAPAPPADTRPPEERYAEQLRQLNDMGFFDFDQNIAALRRSGGSVQGAIEHLLGGS